MAFRDPIVSDPATRAMTVSDPATRTMAVSDPGHKKYHISDPGHDPVQGGGHQLGPQGLWLQVEVVQAPRNHLEQLKLRL